MKTGLGQVQVRRCHGDLQSLARAGPCTAHFTPHVDTSGLEVAHDVDDAVGISLKNDYLLELLGDVQKICKHYIALLWPPRLSLPLGAINFYIESQEVRTRPLPTPSPCNAYRFCGRSLVVCRSVQRVSVNPNPLNERNERYAFP